MWLQLILTFSPPIPLRLYTLPYWSNPPFITFDIRALWRSKLSARAPECQKLKMVGYTSMAPFEQQQFGTAGVEGVNKLPPVYALGTINEKLQRNKMLMTWNCWRVMVDGGQDGSTSSTWSEAIIADDWPASLADDVGGFSLKKSLRMRSTWAFHSRRRRSILSCISSQASRWRSLTNRALPPSVVAMLPLLAVWCRRLTTAGDCDIPGELVAGDDTSSEHGCALAWTSASTANVDDVGRNSSDDDGVEYPLEAPGADNTTEESIWNNCYLARLPSFPAIKTLRVLSRVISDRNVWLRDLSTETARDVNCIPQHGRHTYATTTNVDLSNNSAARPICLSHHHRKNTVLAVWETNAHL